MYARLIPIAAILAVLSLPASATPLKAGDVVTVGDTNANVFTPSPVPSDPDGLRTSVGFSLNGGATFTASAGLFVLDYTFDVPAGPSSAWTQFLSFCLQPDVYLTPFSNPYTVNALGSSGYGNSALIAELWGRYRTSVNSDLRAAAFQVALWELVFGVSDSDLATGAFRLTSPLSAVGALATTWLNSLDGTGPMAGGLVVLINNPNLADRQDLLTQVNVPGPSTFALFALGLLGVSFFSIRRSATA